jgi:hypothetical protein
MSLKNPVTPPEIDSGTVRLVAQRLNHYATTGPTFFIISRSILIRMRNVSDKSSRENQNTHFVFSNFFFKSRAVCEIMWKNVVERDRPQMTIWRMRRKDAIYMLDN